MIAAENLISYDLVADIFLDSLRHQIVIESPVKKEEKWISLRQRRGRQKSGFPYHPVFFARAFAKYAQKV